MSDILQHYGIKRRSGRYKWGTGKKYEESIGFLNKVDKLRLTGITDTEVAKKLGLKTTEFRSKITIANKEMKELIAGEVLNMKKEGYKDIDIAKKLGISNSSVKTYYTDTERITKKRLNTVSDKLKESVEKYKYLDVGKGVERQIGVTKETMRSAIAKLKEEGYVEHDIYIRRLHDRNKFTTVRVLSKEKDIEVVKKNATKIKHIDWKSEDRGETINDLQLKPIKMVDWKRIAINYGDKGGVEKDGIIELRPGVKDLDLGKSNYAQVRIGVGGTHYLKGMAMYSDDLPKGVDIRFNTNKPSGTPKEKVLKPLKEEKDNPFGATIKPGGQRGALNIVNEEGDWDKWRNTLSSQFLSKQPTKLIKERLDATYKNIVKEYDETLSLTQPTVKKHFLESYADNLITKQHELKVQGLPRCRNHVILPLPNIKPNEIFAPNYKNGETVVLIRHPHGGIFEIPELKVNNNTKAKGLLKNAKDAVGIHPSVANKLSGADFDGDSVMVIPNNSGKIKSSRSLKELKNFDPHALYKVDHPTISKEYKQKQMGIVSNLITDMTIKKATPGEIARAVKHSMVVIDAEKHNLDWKRSAEDNGIKALCAKYQTHFNPITSKISKGASTLISLADKEISVGGTKEKYIDKKTGKTKTKVIGAKKMHVLDMVDDPYKLSSGSAVEGLYADYINKLRALENKARKEAYKIKPIERNKQAVLKWDKEIKSLNDKLNLALLNAPRERRAQILAASTYYKNLTYDMDKDQKKKLKNQCLAAARIKAGAKGYQIKIEPSEWEAIQSGAISNNKLLQIIAHSNEDSLRSRAMPKSSITLTESKASKAKQLLDNGKTYSEVAEILDVSTSTLRRVVNEM